MKLLFKYFFDAIKRFPRFFAESLFMCIMCALCTVSLPILLQRILNNLIDMDVKLFIQLSIIAVILFASVILEIWKYISLDKMGGNYISDLLLRLEMSLLNLDEIGIDKLGKNQIDHILYSDVLDIFRVIGNFLPNITTSILISVLLFLLSAMINVKVALFLVLANLIGLLISYISKNRIRKTSSNTNIIIKNLHLLLENFTSTISFIKMNNLDQYYAKRTTGYVDEFISSSINEDKTIYFYGGIMNKIISLLQILFSIVLAALITNSTNDIIVYTLIFDLAMNETERIETLLNQINRSFVCFRNVDNILSKTKEEYSKGIILSSIDDLDVHINSFSYADNNADILSNVCFHLTKGDAMMLKGKNGSGKTTLLKLITGMLNTFSGTIKLNGIDINNIDVKNLHDSILYISQNDYFVGKTIYDYLCLTSRRVIDKNDLVQLFNNIDLNIDIDTPIDVLASNLSGGQKKKLQIARILLSKGKSSLIVIDEIDAGLDINSKKIYEEVVNNIISNKDKIVIIIQHTDSNIKYNKKVNLA